MFDHGEAMSSAKVRVFQCPNCKEYINTSVSRCGFCGAPVDALAAEEAAENTAQVNQACSEANYLKIMARALPGFYLLSWVPFLGGIGTLGSLGLFVVIPVMAGLWWSRFRALQTGDPDYKQAKRSVGVALAIWGATVAVWFIIFAIRVVLAVMAAAQRAG
jgi:hypothetical protein